VQLGKPGKEVGLKEVVARRGRTDSRDRGRVLPEDGLLDVLVQALRENGRLSLRYVNDGRVERIFVGFDTRVDDRRNNGRGAFGVTGERDGSTGTVGDGCNVGDVREVDLPATASKVPLSRVRDEIDDSTDIVSRVFDLIRPDSRDKGSGCVSGNVG